MATALLHNLVTNTIALVRYLYDITLQGFIVSGLGSVGQPPDLLAGTKYDPATFTSLRSRAAVARGQRDIERYLNSIADYDHID
jgi:2-keto-3-deoxy-L-rhamnonate aldolase RhmA